MILPSPGVSVVAAGLVSGLCFIIINGLRKGRAAQADKDAKSKQTIDDTRCACCLKPFVIGRGVHCGDCGSRACRKGCSRWDTPDNAWYCLFCHQRRLWLRRNEKWFETFGGLPADHEAAAHCFSTAKSQVFLGGADYAGVGPGVGLAAGGEEDAGDSVDRVREYVEKIVDRLVGDVDEMPIDRLYDHQAYDQLVENYKEPLAGALARLAVSLQLSISNKPVADTPTMAHAALRDLVERAVEEAKKLPNLGGSDAGRSAEPRDISDQTYEDLLATAILNKVIEKYQNDGVDGNSNRLHNSETSTRTKYITSEVEVGLDEGVEEGSSSLEPLSQDEYSSDCSAPAPKYKITRQEPLSLTIEEHIEEVTTTYTSDEEERDNGEANRLDFRNAHRVPFPEFGMDIIDPSQESSEETQDETTLPTHVDMVTPIESWEENWLFQKKKMQAQSEPVSMLVPNPSEDFRPLIGDREADDTSDLSDCSAQSDEEIENELLEAINNVALKTPESPDVKKVEEIVRIETQITNNETDIHEIQMRSEQGKTTISIGLDRVQNSSTDLQKEEAGADEVTNAVTNGHTKQHDDKPYKIGLEDMLVFHLKDKRTSNLEEELKDSQDHSIEFIQSEKSSVHRLSRDVSVDHREIKISGQSSRVMLSKVDSRALGAERIVDSLLNDSEIETNFDIDNGHRLPQLTRDIKLFDDETNVNVALPQFTRDLKLPLDRTSDTVQDGVESPQFTRDIKLPVNGSDINVEGNVELPQFTRDLKLPMDMVNVLIQQNVELPQFTKDIKLPVDESNIDVDGNVELPQFTRDIKLPVDESNVTVEGNVESPQFTRDLKLPIANVLIQQNVDLPHFTKDIKLPVDGTNIIVEGTVEIPQFTRDLKFPEVETTVNVENGVNLPQLTRDIKLPSYETNVNVDNHVELGQVTRELKPDNQAVQDSALVSRDKDQSMNLVHDHFGAEAISSTPTSSPLRQEDTILGTGNYIDLDSLEEKLVPTETRTDIKLDSLNETYNSYVQSTREVRSSFTEVKEGSLVEARVIFVGSGDRNSHITTTELHATDLQNEDGAQQESEYTEHYAIATQRHLDSLTRPAKSIRVEEIGETADDHDDDIPPPIPSTPPPSVRQCRKAAASATTEYEVGVEPQTADRKRVEVDLFLLATPPRPGTIAEREHKKWENAPPIENNPYSEENIQKRLMQRQYSHKMSFDSSTGENSESSKISGTAIQVVLGAGQPDVKRYGRDYYINDAKKSNGVRMRKSALLNAGSRNSSLSQTSGSYDDDLEPQEKVQYQEPEPMSNIVTEVKTKVSTWQQNNIDSNSNVVLGNRQRVETTIHLEGPQDEVDNGNEVKIKSIGSSISEVENIWDGQNTDELLENVRRNSKNEMNAKLNNQEDAVSVLEARRSLVNESKKSINRIDLKAYGFENEINSNGSSKPKISSRRVVNKLDLKAFGYDAELQRIQSTGRIDARLNNEIDSKPRIVKMKTKSNLTEHHVDYGRSKSTHNLVEYVEASGDFDKTKSTEIFKEDKNLSEVYHDFSGMVSAKSMPNVTKIERYSDNLVGIRGPKDEEDLIISHLTSSAMRKKLEEEERRSQEMIKASARRQGLWKSETTILAGEKTGSKDLSSDEEQNDVIVEAKSTEILSKLEIFERTTELKTSSSGNIDEDLPMPSVRKLAQTFIKAPETKPVAPLRVWNPHSNVKKERPTTPEIHIIETPRQMHSLTARSISKEFREGLRQIPNKMSSPPASHVITEQQSVNAQSSEPGVVSSETDSSTNDIDVIAPGKLKNDIKFWEQLQKHS